MDPQVQEAFALIVRAADGLQADGPTHRAIDQAVQVVNQALQSIPGGNAEQPQEKD